MRFKSLVLGFVVAVPLSIDVAAAEGVCGIVVKIETRPETYEKKAWVDLTFDNGKKSGFPVSRINVENLAILSLAITSMSQKMKLCCPDSLGCSFGVGATLSPTP